MAENLVSRAFTGGKSFMTNHYAIWRNGLGEHQKNWYAVNQGETYAERMFYIRSDNVQSSYYKFLDFLEKVEKKEREKERALVLMEINRIKKEMPNSVRIASAERAAEKGEFGTAYTFLQQNEEEMNKFIDNYQKMMSGKGGNISHSSLFWDSEFDTYLTKKLTNWLDKNADNYFDEDLSLEEIVEQWIEEAVMGADGIGIQSLTELKSTGLNNIKDYFEKNGLLLQSSTKNNSKISKSKLQSYLKTSGYAKTKTGRNRSIKTQARMFGNDVVNATLKGFAQELSQTAKQGKQGLSFNTGKLRKELEKASSGDMSSVQITNDVISYVADEAKIDIEAIKNSLVSFAENDLEGAIAKVEEELRRKQLETQSQVFKIATNVKGYRSNRNMQIKGEGSFAQRSQVLAEMTKEATNLPNFSVDKILFMLNNTLPGCLNENRIHHIVDYLAAICIAWMWDDYTELFSVDADVEAIQTVHMFSAGGIYYSASQILRQTRENLINKIGNKAEQFVDITIKPASFDADSVYTQLVNQYSIEGMTDYQEIQETLAKRWDAMRDMVEQKSKLSIHFKQRELEKIISDLGGILGL